MHEISISVNGLKYTGWKSATITRSIESLAGSYSLTVVDDTDQSSNSIWPLKPQDVCIVRIGDHKLITGYIDNVSPDISAEAHTITISGRDKTADMIDCSAVPKSYAKKTISGLAKTLADPFNIDIVNGSGIDLASTFKYTVNSGETAFEALDKKVKELGLLAISDGLGNLVLTKAGTELSHDSLIYGENIKRGKAVYNYVNRFSDYNVRSQTSGKASGGWNTGKGAGVGISGSARDAVINRNRPWIARAESQSSNKFATNRAEWEALTRAAKSEVFQIEVVGFLQSNGDLWEINKLVNILAKPLYINPAAQMLIASATYELSESGSKTTMILRRPDAYNTLKPIVKKQKNVGWG